MLLSKFIKNKLGDYSYLGVDGWVIPLLAVVSAVCAVVVVLALSSKCNEITSTS